MTRLSNPFVQMWKMKKSSKFLITLVVCGAGAILSIYIPNVFVMFLISLLLGWGIDFYTMD